MPEHETHKQIAKSDYVELKLPKIFSKTAPVNLFLLGFSLLLSFLLGGAIMRIYQLENGVVATPTDAIGAFTSYAKKLGLNTKQFQACLTSGKYAKNVEKDYQAGQQAQVNATPTFFINGQVLVGAQPYSIIKAVIEQELTGRPAPTPTLDPTLTEIPTFPKAKQDVDAGHLPALGGKNAKVTVVEFSDFQCPFCKAFFDDTLSQLKKDYIDTGKVKMAYRHFPISSIHKNAQKAGEASECANEQGKFWQYHDILFQTQETWQNLPTLPASSNTT